ncbi:MAG TPA: SDR family NAD(P)-dependent oxidoreductase [Dongiaceae bacterium]|jgi:NAD(P)-dependent dehydrogenase (short-subunit alcohol dehydrogenase family)|nr:SDR family NAD(P)-dependent oxidoreductase [Dongiaceae bacterium]
MTLEGRTILITGSTDGVGRRVALHLAKAGAEVLVHGRDRARGDSLVAEMRAAGNGKGRFYPADLSSLVEVRRLAKTVLDNHPRLHLLINNAGIGGGPARQRRDASRDGHELRFAVNYLAGFLLTRLLLDRLKASSPARIVNVASLGQHPLDFEDVMLTRGYDGARAYAQSKLAQIMFTLDLARELAGSGVTATSLHPATYMDTTMVRQAGVSPMSSVEEGAKAILNLAVSPQTEGETGVFYNGLHPARANAQAYDAAARERLRALSRKLTGADS